MGFALIRASPYHSVLPLGTLVMNCWWLVGSALLGSWVDNLSEKQS